jgi:hypothetical protein
MSESPRGTKIREKVGYCRESWSTKVMSNTVECIRQHSESAQEKYVLAVSNTVSGNSQTIWIELRKIDSEKSKTNLRKQIPLARMLLIIPVALRGKKSHCFVLV